MSCLAEPQCDAEHFRKTGGSLLVAIGRIALCGKDAGGQWF
jgi:hypothetical protein